MTRPYTERSGSSRSKPRAHSRSLTLRMHPVVRSGSITASTSSQSLPSSATMIGFFSSAAGSHRRMSPLVTRNFRTSCSVIAGQTSLAMPVSAKPFFHPCCRSTKTTMGRCVTGKPRSVRNGPSFEMPVVITSSMRQTRSPFLISPIMVAFATRASFGASRSVMKGRSISSASIPAKQLTESGISANRSTRSRRRGFAYTSARKRHALGQFLASRTLMYTSVVPPALSGSFRLLSHLMSPQLKSMSCANTSLCSPEVSQHESSVLNISFLCVCIGFPTGKREDHPGVADESTYSCTVLFQKQCAFRLSMSAVPDSQRDNRGGQQCQTTSPRPRAFHFCRQPQHCQRTHYGLA